MSEWKMGYKIVRSNLKSAIASSPQLEREYSTERWTYPSHTRLPLMVFKDKRSALKFLKRETESGADLKLFSCLFEESTHKLTFWYMGKDVTLEEVLDKQDQGNFSSFPENTIFAKRVKLLQEIE